MARRKKGSSAPPRSAPADAGDGPSVASAVADWRPLAAVLLAGFVLKLIVLWWRKDAPDFDHPLLDAGFHDWLARGWAHGSWTLPPDAPDPQLDANPFPRPPLYPAVLAAFYKLTGTSAFGTRALQALLGVAAAACAALLSRRLSPATPWGPLVAALLVLLSPELLFFEGELVAAGPAALAVVGLVLLLVRWREQPTSQRAVVVGLALAVAVHLRPNLLVLLPVLLLGVWWRTRDEVKARRVSATALIVGLVALALVPVAVRNQRASGEVVLLSTNGGITLLHGNHDGADGQTMSLPRHPALAAVQDVSPFGYPRLAQTVSSALGHTMSVAETDRWLRGLATTWISEHPGGFLALCFKKLAMILGPVPVSNNKQVALELDDHPILRLLPARWWLLLTLALLGTLFGLTRAFRPEGEPTDNDETVALVVAVGAVVILVAAVVPFLAAARFRVPLVPLMAALASLGVAHVVTALRERRRLALTAGTLAVLLATTLPNWTATAPDAAQWRLDRARAWLYAQRPADAQKELEAALVRSPTHPDVHLNLGYLLATSGDLRAALPHFEQALRSRPDHLQAKAQLGATLYGLGEPRRAAPLLADVVRRVPADVTSRYNYARALEQLGQVPMAKAQLAEVLRQRPDLAPARRALERMNAAPAGITP
jgi:4-amino-4-deoxy-L-arabinose transferase-like glycosyltransferase